MSALAICNKKGELVDSISSPDLRGLGRAEIPNLLDPLWKYFLHAVGRKTTIATSLDTPLGDALTLFVTHNVHRLWIVDGGVPVGIVSLTDICKVFGSH